MAAPTQSAVHGHANAPTSPATRNLLHFAATTRYEDLPADVIRESKRCILDFLGVTIGAVDTEAPSIARAVAQETGGNAQARIIGYGDSTSVLHAALVNGILSHVFDFDDTHIPTILHPTGPLMASGFPVAEWKGSSGKDLIAAHAVGFEVEARASLALYPEHYDRGWHMTGTTGVLGAATSVSRLMGLDEAQLTNALGLAATQAAGHREQFGAMAKSFHSGKSSTNGVLAALMASRGYTAADDSLEGRRGMFYVMGDHAKVNELDDELGQRWEIFRNGFKPYSCGVVIHPGIDAVRLMGSKHGVKPEDVERIDLRVAPLVIELTGKMEPRTGLEGKFSVAFASAIALIEGTADGTRVLAVRIIQVPIAVFAREEQVAFGIVHPALARIATNHLRRIVRGALASIHWRS